MSGSLPYTQFPAEPQLKDVLDQLKKNVFLSLNCHHVGTIQSFDATHQTATVTINYKKTYYQLNPATQLYAPTLIDYPILIDCPVICLGGGPTALTFPIAAGDECLVLFNDRDLDNWFAGGAGTGTSTPRLHSFADAIILVGLRSMGHVLSNYDTVRAVLSQGTTMVGVGPSLIKIANGLYSLNGLLQELVTEIQNLVTATAAITVTGITTGGGVSGVPANAATITAINTNITATALKIAGLLE